MPAQLRQQFVVAAVGSAAEGAALQIEVVPGAFEGHVDGVYVETFEVEEDRSYLAAVGNDPVK